MSDRSSRTPQGCVATALILALTACSDGAQQTSISHDDEQTGQTRPVVSYDPQPSFVKRGCTSAQASPQQFCPQASQ